jgi:hypothetical protein
LGSRLASESVSKSGIDGGPVVDGDRVRRGVAQPIAVVGMGRTPVTTQDSFERRTEPLDRAPALVVAGIGADRDPLDLPSVTGEFLYWM